MYDSVFMSSFGSNIYETLGALETNKDLVKNTVIWNSVGSASLIIFFKILGFTFLQTLEHLKSFELTHTFINGYFIIPEDQDSKIEYIRDWLIEKIEINNLISKETTLSEIFKLTNIFPNFVVWSRSGRELQSLNPKIFPDMTIIDSILSTFSCIGTFVEFKINDDIFSSYFCGDFYPHSENFRLEKKQLNTLYIAHESEYFFNDILEDSPFSYIENEIMNQFIECNNSRVKNVDVENFLILYDDIYKNSLTDVKKDFCFENGKIQAQNFMDGFSNSEYYKLKKLEIKNQK
jgi:hypothetical protein